MSIRVRHSLKELAESGQIFSAVEKYLLFCKDTRSKKEREKGDEPKSVFPNLAGFCRYFGAGLGELERLKDSFPEEADYVFAAMEDEALNSSNAPATLISSYLKYRMDYAKREKLDNSSTDCGEVKVIFEHDITEDGA